MKNFILPEELTVRKTRRMIMPFFIPSLGIDKDAEEEDIEFFANKIAKMQCGNATRFFSAGVWELSTKETVYYPFKRRKSGKFNLDKYNRKHLEVLKERISLFAERNISVILSLMDNCSLHNYRSHWGLHWMNGKNNVNGTSRWNGSVYHYYENPNDEEQVKTGQYCEAYYRYLIENLEREFRPYILYEFGNESFAGYGWQAIMSDLVDDVVGKTVPKWRKMYSFNDYPWYRTKSCWTFATPCIHGIGYPLTYETAKEKFQLGVKFIPSEDGAYPERKGKVLEARIYKILSEGNLGYERNERPFWKEGITFKDDWVTAMNWHGARCMRDGWFRWLEEQK